MNTPSPQRPSHPSASRSIDAQLEHWLRLRTELGELHARLVYLRLLIALGVRQVG